MRHPPYHLRANKAVDRFMLIEAMRRLGTPAELAKYTYYGFGGPYLEEFRLLHESFPGMEMFSIERDAQTHKRQEFHLPCGRLSLILKDFKSFLAYYDSRGGKSVFWLDYTELDYGQFEDFMSLLSKVAPGSLVKITLRAEPQDFIGRDPEEREKLFEEFGAKFGAVLPRPGVVPPADFQEFAALLQDMLWIASQQALPSAAGFVYQPVSSFCYKDGVGILTLAGVVCSKAEAEAVRARFADWPPANIAWSPPKLIDVPFLSTKERLELQRHLPCDTDAGRQLLGVLGYWIDAGLSASRAKMTQYADFYTYYPYFVRAIP